MTWLIESVGDSRQSIVGFSLHCEFIARLLLFVFEGSSLNSLYSISIMADTRKFTPMPSRESAWGTSGNAFIRRHLAVRGNELYREKKPLLAMLLLVYNITEMFFCNSVQFPDTGAATFMRAPCECSLSASWAFWITHLLLTEHAPAAPGYL